MSESCASIGRKTVYMWNVALAAIDAPDPGQDHRPHTLRGIFQKQWCKRIDFARRVASDPSTWQHWLPTGSEWDLKVWRKPQGRTRHW